LNEGKIDGGAGGKFHGKEWNGKNGHGEEKQKRIKSHIENMSNLGVKQDLMKEMEKAEALYKEDKKHWEAAVNNAKNMLEYMKNTPKTMALQHAYNVTESKLALEKAEKKLAALKKPDILDVAKKYKNKIGSLFTKEEAEELDDFIDKLESGHFDKKKHKGGYQKNLFSLRCFCCREFRQTALRALSALKKGFSELQRQR
jgi:hypothetical protein